MVIEYIIGGTLVGASVIGAAWYLNYDKYELKWELQDVFETNKIETRIGVGEQVKIFKPDILSIKKKEYGWDIVVELPKGYPLDKFIERIPAMEQATASQIKTKHLRGRKVELKLGCIPLHERFDFEESLIQYGELSIPYHTSFGVKYLNFHDEATCHLLVAGVTRMGKTVFLRLLFTQLLLATEGNVKFYYMNNKVEDYYPLQGIPQIPEPAESIGDAITTLYLVQHEIQQRKAKLRKAKDSVNVRQYNEKHPDDSIPPMFIVFDEYGRFIDDSPDSKELQALVQEIAETAGYLDVHLVIATQRPDASTVLLPRIRANVLTRVCFQTADEPNSRIVVHNGAAAHLDEIPGRAIILDGTPTLAQIPYVNDDIVMEYLNPYRREMNEIESTGRENYSDVEEIPSFIKGSDRSNRLPRSLPTLGDSE